MTSARGQILDSFEFAPPAAPVNQNAKLKAPLDQQQPLRGTTALDCRRSPGRSAPSRSLAGRQPVTPTGGASAVDSELTFLQIDYDGWALI
jgi:hypothetical protein